MTKLRLALLTTILSALSVGVVQAMVEDETALSAEGSGDTALGVMEGIEPAPSPPYRRTHGESQAPDTDRAQRRSGSRPADNRPVNNTLRPTWFAEAAVLDDTVLDTVRGGFETSAGMRVAFGIERAVFVNGVLASVTTVNVADLGQLSGRGVAEGATVAVIQNGPNNTFVTHASNAGALATVIQNSLDNQTIRAVTTINATVNSMEMLRTARMGQSLRDTMVHSLMR